METNKNDAWKTRFPPCTHTHTHFIYRWENDVISFNRHIEANTSWRPTKCKLCQNEAHRMKNAYSTRKEVFFLSRECKEKETNNKWNYYITNETHTNRRTNHKRKKNRSECNQRENGEMRKEKLMFLFLVLASLHSREREQKRNNWARARAGAKRRKATWRRHYFFHFLVKSTKGSVKFIGEDLIRKIKRTTLNKEARKLGGE